MRRTCILLTIGLIASLGRGGSALSPEEVARAVDASVVRVYVEGPTGSGSGTGFVISQHDQVATNFHVVQPHLERGWAIYVAEGGKAPGQRLAVTVVAAFAGEDLAILQVDGLARPPVRFAHMPPSDADFGPAKGLQVFGIGFPGAADRLGPVTEASFSAGSINRAFSGAWSSDGPQITIIQRGVQ